MSDGEKVGAALRKVRPLLNDPSPTARAIDAQAPLEEIREHARRELAGVENPYYPATRHRWAYEKVALLCDEATAVRTYREAAGAARLQSQFGDDPKWLALNEGLAQHFAADAAPRLWLSAIDELAARLRLSIDEILVALSILGAPPPVVRRVFYRFAEDGGAVEVPPEEVLLQTRARWREGRLSEEQWKDWASKVLVAWEPVG